MIKFKLNSCRPYLHSIFLHVDSISVTHRVLTDVLRVSFRCEGVTCAESRLFARNGQVTCTDENFYNTQCLTSCNAGYEFNAATVLENTRKNKVARLNNAVKGGSGDVHTSRCLDSGEWDTAKPVCVKHNCAPPAAFLDTVSERSWRFWESAFNGIMTITLHTFQTALMRSWYCGRERFYNNKDSAWCLNLVRFLKKLT